MNKYLKQIRGLEGDVYKNMGECLQITIDMVQNTEQQLNRDEKEDAVTRDELGAIRYLIDILLEAFNPERIYDIEILNLLNKILKDWYDDIEFINRTLGTPLHDG